jgi:CelD/BcsL family acetyltransferase involved in cellulose biosynthesis
MNTERMNLQRIDTVERPACVGVGTVYHLDPICDSRWEGFVGSHPNAGIFHSRQWLEALRRTYDYQPLAITTSAPGEPLCNAIVVCRINSWLTGTRLVSLPFSDHCNPLVDNARDLETLIGSLLAEQTLTGCKYVELRPLNGLGEDADLGVLAPTESFFLHILDLTPDTGQLYRRFHGSCIQRKIKKAEKEGLEYEEGRSEELLAKFYKLMLMTRRRHQLPPQPMAWFRNLVECMAEFLKIRVVSHEGRAIASILTVHVGRTHVYKYGCSDDQFHNLGGMPLLMWRAIQDAKNMGASEFDFGRSECDNEGLVAFKDHWGGTRRTLTYYRFPRRDANASRSGWRMRTAKSVFSNLPDSMLATTGRLLYRHIG